MTILLQNTWEEKAINALYKRNVAQVIGVKQLSISRHKNRRINTPVG
jgi:hypothetical protein